MSDSSSSKSGSMNSVSMSRNIEPVKIDNDSRHLSQHMAKMERSIVSAEEEEKG